MAIFPYIFLRGASEPLIFVPADGGRSPLEGVGGGVNSDPLKIEEKGEKGGLLQYDLALAQWLLAAWGEFLAPLPLSLECSV